MRLIEEVIESKHIDSEDEYDRMLETAQLLMAIKPRNPGDSSMLLNVVTAITEYEKIHHPMEPSTPHDIVEHLLESNGMEWAQIRHIFADDERFHDVAGGSCSIDADEADMLADFFNVQSSLFRSEN